MVNFLVKSFKCFAHCTHISYKITLGPVYERHKYSRTSLLVGGFTPPVRDRNRDFRLPVDVRAKSRTQKTETETETETVSYQ